MTQKPRAEAHPQGPSADLSTCLRTQAQHRAQEDALVAAGQTLSYAEVFARAETMATGLRQRGLQRDAVVALVTAREPDSIIALLAILLAGGASLPLDRTYPPARLATMLEDARPALLLATPDAHSQLLAGNPIPCLDPAVIVAQPGIPAPSQDGQGALIYVLFTSGSTGRPKGVAMRSEAIAALVAWHQAHARLGLPARTLQFAPLGFDVAFQEILTSFATGGTLVLASEAERRDPYALLDLIEREHIERVYMPYVALQALAEAAAAAGKAPSTLRDVITAGEQLRITPAIRALFGALHCSVLHNHYGPTEAHVVTAHELVGDPGAWPELPPIGRPLPHVRIRLVDEAEQVVEGAAEGELLLGGTCLAAGYIHQPELTRERFIERDGARWYRTGDRVRDAGDGELHYLGRVDAQIKLDGYRIEPAEIEAVLCRHPAVAEAAVVASGDSAGRRLIAHVVPRDAQAADDAIIAELRAHCHAQLAPYLVPQIFVLVPLLPLTASGKVDRQTLADAHADTAPVWPQSLPLPQQLAALWRQLLGLAEIDPQANLFDLGARSLTVVRALTELRRHGYRKLTAAQIYEHPSVAKLAACLAASTAAPAADAGARLRGERQRAALHRFAPHPRGTS